MKISIPSTNLVFILSLYILPFSSVPILDVSLGAPGAKLFNLLLFALLCVFVLKGGLSLKFKGNLELRVQIVLIAYFVVFVVSALRTFLNFDQIPIDISEQIGGDKLTYLLSFVVKHTLFLVPLFYIVRFVYQADHIQKVVETVVLSTVLFSLFVVYVGGSDLFSFSGVLGRVALAEKFVAHIGIHYNAIASILISAFPFSLYCFDKGEGAKKYPLMLAPFIIFIAGVVTQSRTAILMLLLSFLLHSLVLQRNVKIKAIVASFLLVVSIPVVILGISFASKIFDTGGAGENPLDYLLSGRLESMWIPLFRECISSVNRILIGFGLYGLLFTNAYYQPDFYQAGHAHNAYLNLFIDVGFIVFMFFVIIYFRCMVVQKRMFRKGFGDIHRALFITLFVYAIASLSGRNFFPTVDNFWVLVALGLCCGAAREIKTR